MTAKRFIASTARAALQKVRAELGPDAVILSNRQVPEGAEIVAISAESIGALAGIAAPAEAAPAPVAVPAAPVAPAAEPRPLREFLKAAPVVETPKADPVVRAASVLAKTAPAAKPARVAAAPVVSANEAAMMAEIKAMKAMLTEQVSGFAWSDTLRQRPLRGRLMRLMLAAGFSAVLARKVVENLPDDYSETAATEWLRDVLARNITVQKGGDIIDRGGVYALVGPTGVGKTTTAAKLAARCVMKHGAAGLGLITTDDYRIGAQDQLRIYGRLLGVPVYVAQNAQDLQQALSTMANRHLVLVDTTGMSQRDERVAEQHRLLVKMDVQRLLLINATSQVETLDEVARVYNSSKATSPLAGAIITKTDEAARVGCALDVAIRHRLPLSYVTDGQRVPEDIQAANAAALVAKAFDAASAAGNTAFDLNDDEAGLILAAPTRVMEKRL